MSVKFIFSVDPTQNEKYDIHPIKKNKSIIKFSELYEISEKVLREGNLKVKFPSLSQVSKIDPAYRELISKFKLYPDQIIYIHTSKVDPIIPSHVNDIKL